jgi:hypothetical protein
MGDRKGVARGRLSTTNIVVSEIIKKRMSKIKRRTTWIRKPKDIIMKVHILKFGNFRIY